MGDSFVPGEAVIYRYIPAPRQLCTGIILPPGSIVLGAVMFLYTGVITHNEPSPLIALRPMDRPISTWVTLGPVHSMNGVVFTQDDAIWTEPWEAITLPLDS